MADDACKIEGVDELCATLREMGTQAVRKALRSALNYSGSQMQEAAIARAPEAEHPNKIHPAGQLKADIRRYVTIDSAGKGTCAVGPSKHSFYGSFCEFGTSHQPARPWLRPAFDQSVERAQEVFMRVFGAYIEDFAKKHKK